MARWMRIFAVLGTMMVALAGCVAAPGYGYSQTSLMIGGPQVAFTFSDGVGAYYQPAYNSYIYSDDGYYYRWVGNHWLYARYYGGPWQAVVTTVYLPHLLAYGPPPPLVAYRPYFIWWRQHEARWYAARRPRWWYQHRIYVRHYALWRQHIQRFYPRRAVQGPNAGAPFYNQERRFSRAPQGPGRYAPRKLRGRPFPAYGGPRPFRAQAGYFHPHPPQRGPHPGRPRHGGRNQHGWRDRYARP